MKKKFLCLAACLIIAVCGGCSAQDAKTPLDESMPWGVYEKCTYNVTKYHVNGSSETAVANGTYVTEVDTAGEYSTLKNSFTITYINDKLAEIPNEVGRVTLNAGLTDTYDSSVEFFRNTLVPTKAHKKFNIAQRPLTLADMPERKQLHSDEANAQDGEELFSYTFPSTVTSVSYADPRGYWYECDYTNNKATLYTESVQMNKNERVYSRVRKDITPASNARFDNEQINYVVRAISNIKTKGSATFYLSNFYDSYVSGKYVRHAVSVSCKEKMTDIILGLSSDDFMLSYKEGELDAADKAYKVSCIQADVGLTNVEAPGPSIEMLITDPSLTVTQRSNNVQTKKLLARITYSEYISAKLSYKTVYTLTGYTTSK